MTLTLTPEFEALLQRDLNTGRYRNASEVIETALLVFSDRTPAEVHELNAKIQEGLDSLDRDELYTQSRGPGLPCVGAFQALGMGALKLSRDALRDVAEII